MVDVLGSVGARPRPCAEAGGDRPHRSAAVAAGAVEERAADPAQ